MKVVIDVQAGLLAEGAQRRGRLLAHDAVADQHDRPLGAPAMISAARSRLTGSASTMASGPRGSGEPVTAVSMTSSGSSRCVAPGFSAAAMLNALRTASGTMRGWWRRVFHLVIGLQHLDRVDELVRRLLVHAGEAGLAGERHQRGVVERRVADAGGEVAGAGTERGEADAGLAGEPARGVGHERRALLVAGRHEGDELRAVEGLAEVERLLAGDAEDELDALVLEAVDEELGGDARRVAGRRRREDGIRPVTHARRV